MVDRKIFNDYWKNKYAEDDDRAKSTAYTRPDGVVVYLDKSNEPMHQIANTIRQHGTKEDLVTAVGLIQFYRTTDHYSRNLGIANPISASSIESQLQKIAGSHH